MMRLDCTVSCLILLYPMNSLRPSTHRDIHATVVCQQGAEKIHKWHQRRVRCTADSWKNWRTAAVSTADATNAGHAVHPNRCYMLVLEWS